MAVTAFLASFLDHIGRRAAQTLWPDPEDKEDPKDSEKKESENGDSKKSPEDKKT